MTLEQLDNLVRIGKLKREPPDPGQVEIDQLNPAGQFEDTSQ